ncbi:Na+/H+ antiporter [Paenibacillus gansuensis]|uniref:Na+/H+ antiporter n=1 Tax=Paenibacillus gansuensis TaxID=306542 RepID=A0ABW5PJU9_9BACL
MELFDSILILLAIIGTSHILNQFVPFIPAPLIQIALGMAAAVLPSGVHLTFEPEVFFVLFVAPLLFNDGKSTPREELWRLRAPILLLALGLVFVTVLVAGYAIHSLIPTIPLPAAFALAAILSPTDPVAVSALSGRIRLPKKILHLLEGEALINDASGLVAFKFAVAAAVTGTFSATQAGISFVLISLGGIVCGVLFSFLIIWLRMLLRHFGMEDVTMHMLIQILTPFAIYIGAEHLHASGILAVVAAGIVHAVERDRTESTQYKLRIVSASTWSVILFILNGLVFVLLGLQIPDVISVIYKDEAFDNFTVLGYILFLSLLLILLRFLWVHAFSYFNARQKPTSDRLYHSVLTSLSGVRGAVTLAGAFSIPYALQDGTPFPERELIIFLAAGVILFTLLTASFILPLVVKKDPGASEEQLRRKEKAAKIRVLKAGVRAVREGMNDSNRNAARTVISEYHRMLMQIRTEGGGADEGASFRERAKKAHLFAISTERKALVNAFMRGEVSRETAKQYQEVLNQTESVLSNRMRFLVNIAGYGWQWMKEMLVHPARTDFRACKAEEMRLLRIRTAEAAVNALKKIVTPKNKEEVQLVIDHYDELLQRLKGDITEVPEAPVSKHKREMELHAIQAERDKIQQLYEDGYISRKSAGRLRAFVNMREASVFEQEEQL